MRRASLFLLLFFALAAPAQAATRYIAPSGSDSNACSSTAPCVSFTRAYNVAASGDTVSVAAGSYGAQQVPAGTKTVTFKGVPGAKMSEFDNYADNVTFDDIDVDGGFAVNNTFENHGSNNVTYKNSAIGNVTDEKAALVSGDRFTFDNMVFHDAVLRTDGTHMECVYAIGVEGMTVRKSLFYNCAIMDLAFTYGDWWVPQPPAYGNVTVENNVFSHSVQTNATGWHYISLNVGATGPGGGTMRGWVVRNNTFENTANLNYVGSNSVWANNVGDWNCETGVTFSHNVGNACSATDTPVTPSSGSATMTPPYGWASPVMDDFHLTAGSIPIGKADPANAPALDRDGRLRDTKPDAGAYEYGAGTPTTTPAPTPPPTTTPAPTPPPTTTPAPTPPPTTTPATTPPPTTTPTTSPAPTPPPTTTPAPTPPPTTTPAPTPPPTTTPATSQLVGAWGFNEGSGTTAGDSSGLGNKGIINGPVRTTAGKFGGALTFDGSNDIVTIADAASLDLTRGMTVEAWVAPTATLGFRTVLFKEAKAAGRESYALYASSDSALPAAEVTTAGTDLTLPGAAAISTKGWTYLAASYDGATLRLFQNGVQVASRALTGGFLVSGDPLRIGGNTVWAEWFKGKLDELRLWSGPRTAAQIQTDMNTPIS